MNSLTCACNLLQLLVLPPTFDRLLTPPTNIRLIPLPTVELLYLCRPPCCPYHSWPLCSYPHQCQTSDAMLLPSTTVLLVSPLTVESPETVLLVPLPAAQLLVPSHIHIVEMLSPPPPTLNCLMYCWQPSSHSCCCLLPYYLTTCTVTSRRWACSE